MGSASPPGEPGAARRSDAVLLRRLWPYLAQQRLRLGLALLLYPLSALCVVGPPFIIQQIFDRVVTGGRADLLGAAIGVYLLAVALEVGVGYASEVTVGLLGQRAMTRLRSELFARVQRLDVATIERTPQGRLLTRLTTDVEALSELFTTGAVSILSDLVTLLSVVGAMLYLSWRLTLLAFIVVPPTLLLSVVCQRFARDAFRRIRALLSHINSYLAEHIVHVELVQIFGQQRRVAQAFEGLNEDYRVANRQAVFFDAALYALIEAIGTVAVAASIGWGAETLATGALSAGVLVAFMQYVRRFFVPIRDLSGKWTILQSALAAAERVVATLEAPLGAASVPLQLPTSAGHAAPVLPAPAQLMAQQIQLRGVWFAYPSADGSTAPPPDVLHGLDLTLVRGQKLALVGATGSGKSTVLRLMNRFYDPTAGAVLLDGQDIRELPVGALRRMFGVVLQDSFLFSGSLMRNLALWPQISAAQVAAAVAALGAEELIAALPGGLQAQVRDGGANFSAGQRQLLAMVRALAVDPQVLLFDEATSNIDSETEAQLTQALDVLWAGRTAVVVAHRLSTIERVDSIAVLSGGKVVQQGSFAELSARPGPFAELAGKTPAAATARPR